MKDATRQIKKLSLQSTSIYTASARNRLF